MRLRNIYLLSLILASFAWSCESILENELPSTEIAFEDGLVTQSDYQEFLNAAYDVMANAQGGNAQKFAEVLGEDVFMEGNTGFLLQVYNRASDFFNGDIGGYYSQPYFAITRANILLETIGDKDFPEEVKNRMRGEALAIRAISHFELVRLFGQPYGYTTDNGHLGIVLKTSSEPVAQERASVGEVYEQIIADLQEAIDLLPEENGAYLNRYAAHGYLARVYFLQNDFSNALEQAQAVINSGAYTLSTDINNRYPVDAVPEEALFYTVSTGLEDNRSGTFRGLFCSSCGVPLIKAGAEYYALLQQEPNDKRLEWVTEISEGGSVFLGFTKYEPEFFNVTQISLTELYLMAAECLAELGQDLTTAAEYVNAIKERAGVNLLPTPTSAALIIQQARLERRKEFAAEGINVFDLKRRGVLGEDIEIRGVPWDCDGMVLQFPASEITVEGFDLNPEAGCN